MLSREVEQQVVIKFLVCEGEDEPTVYGRLLAVYGTETLSAGEINKWYSWFVDGWEDAEIPYTGKPLDVFLSAPDICQEEEVQLQLPCKEDNESNSSIINNQQMWKCTSDVESLPNLTQNMAEILDQVSSPPVETELQPVAENDFENDSKSMNMTFCYVGCDYSGDTYDAAKSLMKAQLPACVLQESTDNAYRCAECQKEFPNVVELKLHLRRCHGPKSRTRNISGAKNKDKKTYSCNFCASQFSTGAHLKRHVHSVHLRVQPFQCDVCSKKFSFRSNLKTHYATVHLNKRKFSCPHCGAEFGRSDNLKSHIAVVHEGQQNHQCDTCGAMFGSSANLRLHLARVHKKEKRYSCTECDAMFYRATELRQHITTVHLGQKQFPCSFCTEQFNRLYLLKQHIMLTHHGVEQWFCKNCNFSCGNEKQLESHTRETHPDFRKNKCDHCTATFSQKHLMDDHCQSVHSHVCILCGRSFQDLVLLQEHQQICSNKKIQFSLMLF